MEGSMIEARLEHYEYLVALRDGGITNMWGGAEYLAEEFYLAKREATTILLAWMQTFTLPEDEQPKDGRDDRERRRVR
jgi:hypothetical protein